MFRKIAAIILTAIMCLALGGCYSYKGLDRMTIVMGIAIDYDEENEKYLTTLEIVDISHSSQERDIKNQVLECEGVSITDAFFNATKKIKNSLYFGSCEVLIVSSMIAQKGLMNIIDTFMRTKEMRETAFIIISQEEKAADIFKKAKGLTSTLISADIQQILEQGNQFNGTVKKVKMYQLYIDLLSQHKCLSLPYLRLTDNYQDKVVEVNGTAVFKHDKLKHSLTPEETIYYLMAINEYRSGPITFDTDGKPESDFCIMVTDAETDISLETEGDNPIFNVNIKLKSTLTESEHFKERLKFEELKKLEEDYAAMIEERVNRLFDKLQKEYNCDIVAYGNIIYKRKPKLWEKIKENWFEIYAQAPVNVKVLVNIDNINITR